VERICLITDSYASKDKFLNNEEDGIWYGSDLNYDYRGWLAGSRMTLENAVRNMMVHTGYGLCHAIRMASLNPAKLLGIDNRVGSIAPGKTANLILIDDTVRVKSVILEGELAVQDGQLLI
jgi:N-acetylglucosamine-6-phosphate deacetylase